ncbi:UNVERIFIED_CONTAM: putative metal-dependent phosphoesterase TrpH [Acetivibrio alkalicellulosi]
MINFFKVKVCIILIAILLYTLTIYPLEETSAKESTKTIGNYEIINPYKSVNWDVYGQYKANFHSHTTESDGKNSPKEMIENYYLKGYDILAITDHDFVSTTWDRKDRKPDHYLTTKRLNEVNVGFGRNGRGMISVPLSNEQSMPIDHLNTFWCNFNNSYGATLESNIAQCEKLGGISHINHPIPNHTKRYIDLFLKYPSCVGIEILNWKHGNKNNFINNWDNILSNTMPHRPVWGFSNDDSHSLDEVGVNFNIMLMPKNTEKNIRFSMENGTFYAVTLYVKYGHKTTPHSKNSYPVIKNISVNDDMNTIIITAENYDTIEWISNNKVIESGHRINLNNYENEIGNYIRAQIKGPEGLSYTQPFGIIKKSNIVLGDINGDGVVSSTDYILLKKHLNGKDGYILKGEKLLAADFNNTGSVNSSDLTSLKRYLLRSK